MWICRAESKPKNLLHLISLCFQIDSLLSVCYCIYLSSTFKLKCIIISNVLYCSLTTWLGLLNFLVTCFIQYMAHWVIMTLSIRVFHISIISTVPKGVALPFFIYLKSTVCLVCLNKLSWLFWIYDPPTYSNLFCCKKSLINLNICT